MHRFVVNKVLQLFQLPLLAKELVEQAARRRTYIVRVIYAGLLYVFLIGPEVGFFRGNINPLVVLGRGKELWEALVFLQLAGVALFLPALMAGRITQEKERDSLTLLLLTDLSPTQIILQKYLAGLIPMLTFLLLGLPLAGVAYSFGGFGVREIWVGAMVIGFSCLQVGALALWCSALFRNTVGAFLGTYFIGLAFYGTPGLIYEIMSEIGHRWPALKEYAYVHIPPFLLSTFSPIWPLTFRSWISLAANMASVFLFLGLAIYHLPRRAFAPPARRTKRVFAWLDRIFRQVNHGFGNVVLARTENTLPESDPVAWRAQHKSVLGNPGHLLRLLCIVAIPTVLFCKLLTVKMQYGGGQDGLSILAAIEGTLFVLIIAVTASNIFVGERINQTLDVLLTTPLSAREIVLQKARALRGLLLVAAVVLLGVFGLEAYLESLKPDFVSARISRSHRDLFSVFDWADAGLFLLFFVPLVCLLYLRIRGNNRSAGEAARTTCAFLAVVFGIGTVAFLISAAPLDPLTRKENDLLLYLTNVVLTLGIYLPLVCWLSLWIGLKTRTRTQAIFATLAVIISWCVLPYLIFGGLLEINNREGSSILYLASPLTLPAMNETQYWRFLFSYSPWVLALVNFSFYGAILYLIRDTCLRKADEYLRR